MRTHTHNHAAPRRRRGFTLIELLVVISIIALAATIVTPSFARMFKVDAHAQARSVLRAMLGAARGAAIENNCYTALHIQIGKDEKCWAAVLKGVPAGAEGSEGNEGNEGNGIIFDQFPGLPPKQMPGNIVFGEIPTQYDNHPAWGGSKPWIYEHYRGWKGGVVNAVADFTELTVVFTPSGSVVRYVNDQKIRCKNNPKLFGPSDQAIWPAMTAASPVTDVHRGNRHPRVPEPGVIMMTSFDYRNAKDNLGKELSDNAQWLVLNTYTGQLMEEY